MTRRTAGIVIILAVAFVGAGCSDDDAAPTASTTTLAGSEGADFEGTGLPRPDVTAADVAQFCTDVDDYLAAAERPADELLQLGDVTEDLQAEARLSQQLARNRLDNTGTPTVSPSSPRGGR